MRKIAVVTLTLLLFGCASGPSSDDDSDRKAAETNTALARGYMERGQSEIALDKLKRAVAHDRTYAPAHTLLGVLYESIGDMKEAEKQYRLAVRYDPSDGDVNNNLGAFLCGLGKQGEADQYFQTAVTDHFYSTPEVALANAGSCALAAGDLDKAERYLRQSLDRDGKLAAALLPMAQVSYQKKAYLQARAFLQRYEEVATKNRDSLLLGYRVETQLGDEKTADGYRTALAREYPDALGAGGTAGRDQQ